MKALFKSDKEIVKLLIDNNADLNIQDKVKYFISFIICIII
jgi:hypothetical protein